MILNLYDNVFIFIKCTNILMIPIFYYMVFTCDSAGKIRSSICMQDIVKPGLHYQINLTRFLYKICLTDKSNENNYLYV